MKMILTTVNFAAQVDEIALVVWPDHGHLVDAGFIFYTNSIWRHWKSKTKQKNGKIIREYQ